MGTPLALALAGALAASAPPDAPGFAERVLVTGLDGPVSMALAPDGRVFVCEQAGRVRVVRDGRLSPRPLVTVPTEAVAEEGLLGIALDPGFARNGRLYLLYTAHSPRRHNRLVRYEVRGDTVARGSERVLFELDPHDSHLHAGGALRFGRDRMLYVGTGDNERDEAAQSLRSTLGKVLRLTPDGGIPRDNPFVGVAEGRYRAIWARGLRNVFSMDADPATGRLYLNDVGASAFEEIDEGRPGGNYGWPSVEGPGSEARTRDPVHAYSHQEGCAITGGAFYAPRRPSFGREWAGRYFFADFCRGAIRWIDPANPGAATHFRTLATPGPVALACGADGALWVLARGNVIPTGGPHAPGGALLRIERVARVRP